MSAELVEKELPLQLLPYGMRAFLQALHNATVDLIDSRASYIEQEEMFAVFDQADFTKAYAFLYIGLAKYAAPLSLTSEELPTRILLHVSGKRRQSGVPLSSEDILPEREDVRCLLDRILRENGIAFLLREEKDVLTLSISLPRFLVDRYEVAAKDTL